MIWSDYICMHGSLKRDSMRLSLYHTGSVSLACIDLPPHNSIVQSLHINHWHQYALPTAMLRANPTVPPVGPNFQCRPWYPVVMAYLLLKHTNIIGCAAITDQWSWWLWLCWTWRGFVDIHSIACTLHVDRQSFCIGWRPMHIYAARPWYVTCLRCPWCRWLQAISRHV